MKPNSQWEEEKKLMLDLVKAMDWPGMAEAFAKGNMEWHAKEWEQFVKTIATERLKAFCEELKNHKEFGYDGTPAEDMEFVAVEDIDTLLAKYIGEEK